MKHNICLYNKSLSFILILFFNINGFAKIVSSEFLNQAAYGSEGPQIAELEFSGKKAYLLTYNIPGKDPLFKNLSQKEFLKLQKEMHGLIKIGEPEKKSLSSEGACEREIIYTKVELEDKVSNSSLCWESMGAKKRLQISDWFIEVRKSLL